MDVSKLSLSSLRDKISSKLNDSSSKNGKSKKQGSDQSNKKDVKSEKASKQEPKDDKKKSKGKSKGKEKKRKEEFEKKNVTDEEESEESILRREALALGATEEDLALLEGIEEGEDSEQEFEADSSKLDKSFGSDLSQFMKGIGLDGSEAIVIDDEEAAEEIPELVEIPEEAEEEGTEKNANESEEEDSEEQDSEEEESEEVIVKKSKSVSHSESESDSEEVQMQVKDIKKKETKKQSSDKITDFSSVSSSKLIVPNRTDWYNVELERIDNPEKLDRFAKERLYERAKQVVENDNKIYLQEFTSNNSQKKFLSQILSDGTLNDKISALTLLIQEAPLHNIKAFDTLLGYCEKKSRTAALQSINALKDLLLNGVLPDRKLLAFEKQPLVKTLSDVQLATYYFEDYLKKAYFKLVTVLEVLSHDPIIHVRMNVVSHLFDLLKAKPEQEANLLRLGVNKLGDIENKVASKTSYQILQLEQAHPAMKKIITDAVIDIIFKNNNEYHAKYYSVVTLNQTILTRREEDLANELIKTYFALFEKVLVETDQYNVDKKEDKALGKSEKGRKNNRKNFKKGKKGGKSVKQEEKTENEIIEEKNSKLFSALLTGLNRAFPFSNLPNETFQKHLDTLFKITHSTNFNTSIQALVLINHIITEQKLSSDRYYRTLYESLLDPRLVSTSKQGIYLNLLFKSLKNDKDNVPRVLAFVKRILQICTHWLNIGAISGMLFLLMELSKTYSQIQDLMIDVASRPDEESNEEQEVREYDSRKRDPKFANADKSSLWELNEFVNHYHPTIAIYASSLVEGKEQAKPDLGLFSLAHFLDRFVYKNAKQKPITKGSSIMQPLGGAHTGSLLVRATNMTNSEVPANTEQWLSKKVEDIRPDEMFFHQYFTSKTNKLRGKKNEDSKNILSDDEEAADLADEEIWQALVKSKPEVEEGDDDEMGFSDFDENDFSDLSDDEDGEVDEEEKIDEESNAEAEALRAFEQKEEGDSEPEQDLEDGEGFDEEEGEFFGINTEDELSDSEVEVKMLGDDDDEDSEVSDEEREQDEQEEQEATTTKDSGKSRKRSSGKPESSGSKKRKLKNLPIFASADDYSSYLNSDDEDYS